jgi:hypothetical protein
MRVVELLAVVVLASLNSGCGAAAGAPTNSPRDDRPADGIVRVDPENVPEDISLFDEGPVLLVRVTADVGTYKAELVRKVGVPTNAIVQHRDVQVTARSLSGEVVGQVTVDNPRLARTVGSKEPKKVELPSGRFSVLFGSPTEIRSVEVVVRAGPDAGLRQIFAVEP